MKNKILVLFLLCLIIIPIFNNLYAVSYYALVNKSFFGDDVVYEVDDNIINEAPLRPLKFEEFNLKGKILDLANANGYFSLVKYNTEKKVTSYILYVPSTEECKLFIKTNLYNQTEVFATDYVYECIAYLPDPSQSFLCYANNNINDSYVFNKSSLNNESDYITNIPIYTDETFTEIYKEPNVNQDDSIGDPNSDLQLSYEYNEDNTSCHINATLKNGVFTDQIYYSNYQPGITGELLSKKAFPKNGIDVTENQSLFFQAENKDGKILAKNSLSIFRNWKIRSK